MRHVCHSVTLVTVSNSAGHRVKVEDRFLTHIDRLSKGEGDVYNADPRLSRVCFGVSDLQVNRGLDCAADRLDVMRAAAHRLETDVKLVTL